MRRRLGLLGAGAVFFCAVAAGGGLCRAWSEGEVVGALDNAQLPEASGLAASRRSEILYHINDSGGGPFLYTSRPDGGGLRRLRLRGLRTVFDPEALALGELRGRSVVVVADIGDNSLVRKTVELFAVVESEIADGAAPVSLHLSARYPGGPYNAEAIAMAPDGAIYVFTKSWTTGFDDSAPSSVFRLNPEAWERPERGPVTLEPVGSLDLPALAIRERAPFSDVVTDASMAADGSRFLVLTYGYAWEFALDLSGGKIPPAAEMQRGRDYELIRLKPLLGKETIAYLPGDRSFLFGKEFKPDAKPSELIRMDCLD